MKRHSVLAGRVDASWLIATSERFDAIEMTSSASVWPPWLGPIWPGRYLTGRLRQRHACWLPNESRRPPVTCCAIRTRPSCYKLFSWTCRPPNRPSRTCPPCCHMNCLPGRICSHDLASLRTLTATCRGTWSRYSGACASSWYDGPVSH